MCGGEYICKSLVGRPCSVVSIFANVHLRYRMQFVYLHLKNLSMMPVHNIQLITNIQVLTITYRY